MKNTTLVSRSPGYRCAEVALSLVWWETAPPGGVLPSDVYYCFLVSCTHGRARSRARRHIRRDVDKCHTDPQQACTGSLGTGKVLSG